MYDATDLRDVLADELVQRRESGYAVDDTSEATRHALARASGPADPDLLRLLEALETSERRPDWPFTEIDSAEELIAAMPPGRRSAHPNGDLRDRIGGAWLGRCAGCLLGKPVEGWTAAEVDRYLDLASPFSTYLPALRPHPPGLPPLKPSWPEATDGAVDGMARDDDLDYSVVVLLILERAGRSFRPDDVGQEWLARLPAGLTYTAERAAYRNLLLGLRPPATARHHNPYREWIGALIRADVYAYAAPGDPWQAARLAARDASLSHVGNGIAAAMWAAALISLALSGVGPRESVPEAARTVPEGSRLRVALEHVIGLYRSGCSWETARPQIVAANAHYGWVHAVPNVATIASSLLWGGGDFERSVRLAIRTGGDTDSNAATVGSAAGALLGERNMPNRWIEPLHDRLRSAVAGYGEVRISELADRAARLAEAMP